ncbi:unnamed protein product [Peniophora sp. CBMAI 1063]|nr:unnamed protein product [Peniophora sp. CBMAI 1063]
MPAERTPKMAGSARRQPPPKQRGNDRSQRSARGSGNDASKKGVRPPGATRGPPRLKEYEPPTYSQAQSLYFTSSNWNDVETMVSRMGITSITFDADFRVSDAHLQIIAEHRWFANSLEMIALGDEDTGNGTLLTDEGVLKLVSATRNLRVLWLSSCLNLTDATLVNVLEHCPRLESLRISDIGLALKHLVLLSQTITVDAGGEREAKALSKAKKRLAITVGIYPGKYDDDTPNSVFFNGKMHLFGIPV